MKKLLVVLFCLFLLNGCVLAQFEKGTWTIGTTGRVAVTNWKYWKNLQQYDSGNFQIHTAGGYFLADKLAVGVDLDLFGTGWNEYSGDWNVFWMRGQRIGLFPFIRYYFPVNRFLSFFGEAKAGYYGYKNDFYTSGLFWPATHTSGTGFGLQRLILNAGCNYFLTRRFALECSVTAFDFGNTGDYTGMGIPQYLNFIRGTALLGIRYYFFKDKVKEVF
jgi:hypothetical protein